MLKQIKTTKDVVAFAKQIIKEGVNFHCDEDFKNYINLKSNKLTYSTEEAELRNELMNQCFAVCEKNGVNVYGTMGDVLLKETGLHKFIPLSTQSQ